MIKIFEYMDLMSELGVNNYKLIVDQLSNIIVENNYLDSRFVTINDYKEIKILFSLFERCELVCKDNFESICYVGYLLYDVSSGCKYILLMSCNMYNLLEKHLDNTWNKQKIYD